jgi:hypothetical protein
MIVRVKNGICSLMHLTQAWKVFSLCRMWISFSPCFYAVQVKELYEKMKLLLNCIQYNIHLWNTCGDLKVVVLLVGMQLDFTRFCCFFCEWDFGTKDCHCCVKEWYRCESFQPGQKDFRNEQPLVHLKKIFFTFCTCDKEFCQSSGPWWKGISLSAAEFPTNQWNQNQRGKLCWSSDVKDKNFDALLEWTERGVSEAIESSC